MSEPAFLTHLHVELARIFFSLGSSEGYLVAGGAGLLASDLIARPTTDIDLFASAPIASVSDAKADLVAALLGRGYDVSLLQDSATFCRMIARHEGAELLVDLAIDSPPISTPTITLLGPTLAPTELAGRKMLALFGRAEARDFADVYVLAQRFSKDLLLEQAQSLDAGFDRVVLAQMLGTLSRFTPEEIPLAAHELDAATAFFSAWAQELR